MSMTTQKLSYNNLVPVSKCCCEPPNHISSCHILLHSCKQARWYTLVQEAKEVAYKIGAVRRCNLPLHSSATAAYAAGYAMDTTTIPEPMMLEHLLNLC